MARVYPDTEFQDVYNARNIYTTNIQGDDYKVRRSANDSNLDPRASSEWQKNIVDAFSLANRIWSNKRECWKDHFRRGERTYRYGSGEYALNPADRERLVKLLSGYHLAINVLLESLREKDGKFYDPNCFCITPTDLFGNGLNTYAILDIEQHTSLDYKYHSKKLPYNILAPENHKYNRFRSAVHTDPPQLSKCLLTAVGCVPRDQSGKGIRDITLIDKIVMWPNFYFIPHNDPPNYSFGLWNPEHFIYQPIPDFDLPVPDGSMRGVVITLIPASEDRPLCSLNNLQIYLYYSHYKMDGFIRYTDGEPSYDIYLGDELLGRFGAGGGSDGIYEIPFTNNFLNTPSERRISWKDHLYPVIPGYQPHMYPPGKLTEARMTGIEFGSHKIDGKCLWLDVYQYWETEDPVEIKGGTRDTQFKLNIWGYGRAYDYPNLWWPYGNCELYGMQDDGQYHPVTIYATHIIFDGKKNTYCSWDNQSEFYGYFNTTKWMTKIMSSPHIIYSRPIGTMLGDPRCEPVEVDEGCLGPNVGNRGLFFIERHKEFKRRPVACRCPEYNCPTRFNAFGTNACTLSAIRPCPDNPAMALLGDECVPCVGADKRGLVYDNLI